MTFPRQCSCFTLHRSYCENFFQFQLCTLFIAVARICDFWSRIIMAGKHRQKCIPHGPDSGVHVWNGAKLFNQTKILIFLTTRVRSRCEFLGPPIQLVNLIGILFVTNFLRRFVPEGTTGTAHCTVGRNQHSCTATSRDSGFPILLPMCRCVVCSILDVALARYSGIYVHICPINPTSHLN